MRVLLWGPRIEVYEGLCAQRAYRHIKPHTEPGSPRCEDFLYIIKRGVGLRAALWAVLGRQSDGKCPSGLRLKDSLDRDAHPIFLGFT